MNVTAYNISLSIAPGNVTSTGNVIFYPIHADIEITNIFLSTFVYEVGTNVLIQNWQADLYVLDVARTSLQTNPFRITYAGSNPYLNIAVSGGNPSNHMPLDGVVMPQGGWQFQGTLRIPAALANPIIGEMCFNVTWQRKMERVMSQRR